MGESPKVSVMVAQHVLWHFGDRELGLEPGHFTQRLLATMSAADSENRAKLAQVFPDVAHAFHSAQQEAWGIEWLRTKVKKGLVPDRSVPDLFDAAMEPLEHKRVPVVKARAVATGPALGVVEFGDRFVDDEGRVVDAPVTMEYQRASTIARDHRKAARV